jgi:hypothetical protein
MPVLLLDRAVRTSPLPLITTAEARSLGIPVHSKAYHRVRTGIYVEAKRWRDLPAWQKYQVRVHALLRKSPDAILCLESAAVIHGLPFFGEPRDIHVYDPDRRSSRRFGDVCVHTSADPRDIETIDGISVTSLVDTAADLARVLSPAHALAVVDSAISTAQGGTLELDRLRELAASRSSSRARAQLEWLWQHADGRAESPGESISRAVIAWSGFERPDLQREFRYEGFIDRCDFSFPSVDGIGESDGWGKYDLSNPDAAARHLKNEKKREDRLRRHGHAFARWDYADAHRVAPLCLALKAAGIPIRYPAQPAKLATLRVDRRSVPSTTSVAARETTSDATNHNARGFSH